MFLRCQRSIFKEPEQHLESRGREAAAVYKRLHPAFTRSEHEFLQISVLKDVIFCPGDSSNKNTLRTPHIVFFAPVATPAAVLLLHWSEIVGTADIQQYWQF